MKHTKSLEMQKRAMARIPGMTQLLSKRPDMFAPDVWPGYFSRARGVEVWDLDGNRYIDMSIAGIGANVLGYADPEVDDAVRRAVEDGNSCSLNCPEEVELADLLCETHPWAEKVRYARTGGEAMAVAVRIARASTGRDVIAFCGYHGWHDWYLAANLGTENALGEHLLSGLDPASVPRCLRGTSIPFRYNHLEELDAIIDSNGKSLAAIIMEPIRNLQPEPGFLEGVRARADSTGAVFVIDEISAAFRMNSGGAPLSWGSSPMWPFSPRPWATATPSPRSSAKDRSWMLLRKPHQQHLLDGTDRTGGGAGDDQEAPAGEGRGPFDGHRHENPAGMAEGCRAKRRPDHRRWDASAEPFQFHVRQCPCPEISYVQLMLERGFLASTLFYAMYAHNESHVAAYLDAASEAFSIISRAIASGSVEKQMKGRPATSGFKRLA